MKNWFSAKTIIEFIISFIASAVFLIIVLSFVPSQSPIRFVVAALPFLGVVSFNWIVNQRKKKLLEILKKAQLEHDLENYSNAITLYKTAIIQDRKNPYIYRIYANTQLAMKDYLGSISSLSKAIELKPNYDDAYLWRAFSNIQIRNYRKALEDCNQVIFSKADKDVPAFAYVMRGTVFIHLRNLEQALGAFNDAYQLQPDSALVNACRAEVYCYLEKYDQALESAQRAIDLNQDLDVAYLWRGWAKCGLSKFEEALVDCERCLTQSKEEGDTAKILEVRGLVYKSTQNFDQALEDLELSARIYKEKNLPTFYKDVQKQIQEVTELKTKQNSQGPSEI